MRGGGTYIVLCVILYIKYNLYNLTPPSYAHLDTSRLWCVIEHFTFLKMAASLDRVAYT